MKLEKLQRMEADGTEVTQGVKALEPLKLTKAKKSMALAQLRESGVKAMRSVV